MSYAWKVTVKTPWKKYAKGLSVQIVTSCNRPTSKEIFDAFKSQLGIEKESGANPSLILRKSNRVKHQRWQDAERPASCHQ